MKVKDKKWRSKRRMKVIRAKERKRALRTRRQKANKRRGLGLKRRSWTLTSIRVQMPEQIALDLHPNHGDVCKTIQEIRSAVARSKHVQLDFSRTKKVIAGGMLRVYAELHALATLFPRVRFTCKPPKDDVVDQVLQHLSLYDFFGYTSNTKPTRSDVVSWKTASSNIVDGVLAGQLLETYHGLQKERAKALFRGTTEAISNVIYHAYPESVLPDAAKWWMFCREDEDKLVVAVCDRGIGIPRSLPARYPREVWGRLVDRFSFGSHHRDGAFIRAALEMRRSRTGKSNRGKGLHDVVSVARSCEGSRVFIFSNRACVTYDYLGEKIKVSNFKRSIEGTLILWFLPLQK